MKIFKKNWTKVLIKAALKNDLSGVRQAVENGAHIDFNHRPKDDQDSGTALIIAAYKGYIDIVEYLASQGADVNLVDAENLTALSCQVVDSNASSAETCIKIGRILLDHGANIDAKDKKGKTPLYFAVRDNEKKFLRFAEWLIKNGADVDLKANNGKSPLDMIKGLPDERRNRLFKIANRGVGEPQPLTADNQTLKTAKAPSENIERLDDNQLLHEVTSTSGLQITTIFNFLIGDITRVQTKNGVKISEDKTKFSELDDLRSIKPMFDELVELGGNPPDHLFGEKPRTLSPAPRKPAQS